MTKGQLFGLFVTEIAQAIAPLGIEKYRAAQIARWLYQCGVTDFRDMTNLPATQRDKLAAAFSVYAPLCKARQESADGKTTKYLLFLSDGHTIETVLMRQPYGNSVCVSTQIGCAMGCLFCASAIGGFVRNLTEGEMVAQVLYIQRELEQAGQNVTSVVIMGSGEPFLNYDHVLRFIRLCHDKAVLGLSYRSFTVSTSGIVPGINRLAEEGLPITLAISLHATDDNLRTTLMPINKTYGLKDILAAADHYSAATGRRVTYEYTLIRDVNDRLDHAKQLASLLKGKLAAVNLIPVNPVPEQNLHRPSQTTIDAFASVIKKAGIAVTVRRERGSDIQAACGQLKKQMRNIGSEENFD